MKSGSDDAEEVDDEFDEDSISITDDILADIDKNGNGVNHEDKEEDEKKSRASSISTLAKSGKKKIDKVSLFYMEKNGKYFINFVYYMCKLI